MVKKDFTEQIEMQLIEMAQTGKLPIPLSDLQLKSILIQLQSRKRETKITRIWKKDGESKTNREKT